MNCTNFIVIGHLLMLTYLHVENVPSILDKFCFWLDLCVLINSVFSRECMVLGAFGCFSFVINLCELLLPFSCELFQYCF